MLSIFPRAGRRDCGFNHTEAFECPFHASGSFSFEERDSCPDFMQVGLFTRQDSHGKHCMVLLCPIALSYSDVTKAIAIAAPSS